MQKATMAQFQPFDASDWRIGIALSLFNREITEPLHANALKRAEAYKIKLPNIRTVVVAGAAELPLALQSLADSKKYQVLLAIGCVIKGETPHFDYVCKIATEGILRVELDNKIPIGYGLLTCDNMEQAKARQHLGGEHLDAVLHLAKELTQT